MNRGCGSPPYCLPRPHAGDSATGAAGAELLERLGTGHLLVANDFQRPSIRDGDVGVAGRGIAGALEGEPPCAAVLTLDRDEPVRRDIRFLELHPRSAEEAMEAERGFERLVHFQEAPLEDPPVGVSRENPSARGHVEVPRPRSGPFGPHPLGDELLGGGGQLRLGLLGSYLGSIQRRVVLVNLRTRSGREHAQQGNDHQRKSAHDVSLSGHSAVGVYAIFGPLSSYKDNGPNIDIRM